MLSDDHLIEFGFFLGADDLPSGWTVASLQEVSNKITDGTHKTPKYQPSGVRFISIKNIRPFQPVNFEAYEKYISPAEHAELTKRCKPEFGDILFPRIGTIGFAKRIDFKNEVSIFVGLGLIKPNREAIDERFLEFFMNTRYIANLSAEKANGSGRMTLPLEQTRRFPLPLPPLPEQRRIVEKIETLFTRLDKGEEAVRQVQALLKRHRQSVLKAAMTGGLVGAASGDWPETNLGALLTDMRYGTAKKCSPEQNGTAVLRIPNVVAGEIDLTDLKYTELEVSEMKKLALKKGDLLIVRSNGSANLVGRGAVVSDDAEGLAFAGYLIRLRVDQGRLLPEFLHLVLSSPLVRASIERQARSTSGVHNINSGEVEAIAFRLPPVPIQAAILEEADRQLAKITDLETWCETEFARSAALRQSILKQAFSGRLVPQDPSDEPASALLARIRASRAAAPGKARKSKSRV